MGQVPTYAIIGNGRMARHMCHYLSLLNIPHQQWSRQSSASLEASVSDCHHVLLLISDQAIEPFIQAHACLKDKCLVHFSGALTTRLAHAAHPLMTFSESLYRQEDYRKVVFVIEHKGPEFSKLCPGLPNQSYSIPVSQKPLYHSLCVLSGNFTTILWQKVFHEFEEKLQLPREVLYPYLEKTMQNLMSGRQDVLTGPIARNDTTTIDANITALTDDPFQQVYQAIVEAYKEEKA